MRDGDKADGIWFDEMPFDAEDVKLAIRVKQRLALVGENCIEGNIFTTHCHKCSECKTIWHHDPRDIPDFETEIEKAHRCPNCRRIELEIYNGDELPT